MYGNSGKIRDGGPYLARLTHVVACAFRLSVAAVLAVLGLLTVMVTIKLLAPGASWWLVLGLSYAICWVALDVGQRLRRRRR